MMRHGTLEREVGTPSQLYYISACADGRHRASSDCSRRGPIAGAHYINLSMFFAFAVLYPETQFLLFSSSGEGEVAGLA